MRDRNCVNELEARVMNRRTIREGGNEQSQRDCGLQANQADARKAPLAETEQDWFNQSVPERKRFAMKTRLNPLESRLQNSPTP